MSANSIRRCSRVIVCALALGVLAIAQIYMDQLAYWDGPSGVYCNGGVLISPAGHISCNLSGHCHNSLDLRVTSFESWACGNDNSNSAQVGAYVLYSFGVSASYPSGLYAWADADPEIGGDYPDESEEDCNGYQFSSGVSVYPC